MTEERIIDLTVKKSTENVFEILRKNGFEIKESKSTFQRTEQLLYLVPQLKEAINHNKQRIDDLKRYGIPKSSNAVKIIDSSFVRKEDNEIVEQEISKLLQRNYIISAQLKWINGIVESLRNNKFYDLIELKYYEQKSYEEIAEYFDCDVSTVSRNKNKLINKIKGLLFPANSIEELGH